MKFKLLVLLVSIGFTIYSQKKKTTTLGKATIDELKMKIYEKDSTANAVVLYEHANLYLDPNFDYKTRVDYYYRIKILSKEGLKYGNVAIDFYSEKQVVDVKGISYNLSDIGAMKPTNLSKDKIYTVDESQNWTTTKFTLPNIRVGSVIEYSYSIISPYLGIDDWYFQSDIPKISSEFDAAVLGNYKYNIRIVGFYKLDKDEPSIDKKCVDIEGIGLAACAIYSYGMYNIPAFKEEDYMLSKKNYISRLVFDLETHTSVRGVITKYTDTWKNADKKLKKIFLNNQTSKKGYFKRRIPENILNTEDDLQRAKKIYSFIQNHYTWNNRYWNSNDEKVKDAFDNKIGSAGEINLSLYNSLNAAEIPCSLVILATRNHGIPTTLYPVIFDFNYVIVKTVINNITYYLDATEDLLPFGQVPERCLNGRARVINFKKKSNWVVLEPKFKSSKKSMARLKLNEDGDITGSLQVTTTGYDAIHQRSSIDPSNTDGYIEKFETRFPDIEVEEYKVNNYDNLEKPLKESYKINLVSDEELGNSNRINPFIFERIKVNPFKLKERNYPVDFGYAKKNNFYLSLEIPKNYTVKNLPQSKAFALPNNGGRFILKTTHKGNIINVYVTMEIRKKSFTAEEYYALKEFFNKIIQAESEFITLERI